MKKLIITCLITAVACFTATVSAQEATPTATPTSTPSNDKVWTLDEIIAEPSPKVPKGKSKYCHGGRFYPVTG